MKENKLTKIDCSYFIVFSELNRALQVHMHITMIYIFTLQI